MELIDRLQTIAERVPSIREDLQTEEATKNALIMPFLQALGYDVFNPKEVVPEFTADVGIKRGEKVDYAILLGGQPIILVECKCCGASLDSYSSQLFRYFTTTQARLAILTDGVFYRFYTDLRQPNKMDDKPFMQLNLLDLREAVVAELAKLAKPTLNLDAMLASASDLKYNTEIKRILSAEMSSPSDGFVRFFAEQLYEGQLRQNVIERFRTILKRSTSEFVSNLVDQRLKAALLKNKNGEPGAPTEQAPPRDGATEGREQVETTADELQALYIVKAILRDVVPTRRIAGRDVRSYFGVLLDDNNRKPICRFWFNRSQRYLGIFDAKKTETRIPIGIPEDIFEHADALRQSLEYVLAE
jgi:hypothetical protein